MDYTTEYARAVTNGEKIACQAEIAACKRHLDDLKRPDLEWRPNTANYHIEFIETLTYYDNNERKRKPVKLRGFQKFIIGNIMGWYKNGIRRYRETYIQVARKNGKSALSAFMAVDYSLVDAIYKGQIYTAANNLKQARIVYDAVVALIENDPDLQEYYDIKEYKSEIICKAGGSKIMALSGDTKRDGFLPYMAVVDELHLLDGEMYKSLLDGQIGLHNSLLLAITTAGFDLNGACYKQYKFAKQVAQQAIRADYLFVYIAELDLPDSHEHPEEYEAALWSEENWAKANPLLLYKADTDTQLTQDPKQWEAFRAAAQTARMKGGADLRDFITKHLDVWTTIGGSAFVSVTDWQACGTDRKIEAYKGKEAYLGIDLSSRNDLSSIALLFPVQQGVNKPYIWTHSYLPKNTVPSHIRKDRAPYDTWEREGFVTYTDCNGTNGYIQDYKYILEDIRRIIKEYNIKIKLVGYDPMGASGIIADLNEITGAELIEVGQYPKALNDATRYLRGLVQGGGIEYDKANEMMTWSMINAQAVLDAKKQMIVDKRGDENRIDVVDSIIDCVKVAQAQLLADAEARKETEKAKNWLDIMNKL